MSTIAANSHDFLMISSSNLCLGGKLRQLFLFVRGLCTAAQTLAVHPLFENCQGGISSLANNRPSFEQISRLVNQQPGKLPYVAFFCDTSYCVKVVASLVP